MGVGHRWLDLLSLHNSLFLVGNKAWAKLVMSFHFMLLTGTFKWVLTDTTLLDSQNYTIKSEACCSRKFVSLQSYLLLAHDLTTPKKLPDCTHLNSLAYKPVYIQSTIEINPHWISTAMFRNIYWIQFIYMQN